MISPAILDDNHTYRLADGTKRCGISEILRRAGYLDDMHGSQDAMDRGTRIHKAIELDLLHWWDNGAALDESSIEADEIGYLHGARRAVKELGISPLRLSGRIGIEIPVGNVPLGYGTQIDVLASITIDPRWTGQPCVINWKSSIATYPHYPLQAALEALCVSAATHRLSIHLTEDGGFRPIEHKDRDDFVAARAAVTTYHDKCKRGLIHHG